MYRKVILAYDGSRDGGRALIEGAEVAELCKAEVTLLAVVDVTVDAAMAEGYTGSSAAESQIAQFKEVLALGKQRLEERGLEAHARITFGNPGQQIAGVAEELDADLVVIGHRQHGLWSLWIHEPVGTYLMKHLPCSLLIVEPKDHQSGTA